jgi:S1-C subfamily serine protease
LFIGMALACAAANGQCYVDPYTGQRICTNPNYGWQPFSGSDHRYAAVPATRLAEPQFPFEASAHCRITVGDGSTGSGTLVDRNEVTGLVLTCAHLFDNATSNIIVGFPGGKRFVARLVERDRANDLAALLIRRPDVEPLAAASRADSSISL